MATSTNYLWTEPNDSDLVKNGASAIRTLGNAIDASLWSSGFGQAGKNKFINGDFGIWQRGTTFTDPTTGTYTADRWRVTNATANPTSRSVTQQAFTAGSAPVAGYEGTYFIRQTLTTVGTCTGARLEQRIEDVRTFAGQTATISFWAKSDTNRTNEIILSQNFGSGGSTQVDALTSTFATTSSWARFTFTVSIASVSGKTIGTSSFLSLRLGNAVTNGSVLDLWGVQIEAGSTATPFQTATGTIQGELAACQRYYQRFNVNGNPTKLALGLAVNTTVVDFIIPLPVTLRSVLQTLDYSALRATVNGTGNYNTGTWTTAYTGSYSAPVVTYTHGTAVFTANQAVTLDTTTGYLGLSAEL